MNKNNTIKKYFIIFLSTYTAYFLSATYSETLNLNRDFWYTLELIIYFLVTFIQSLIILILYYIFFDLIFKIKLKLITLYFLILLITLFYFILVKLNITDNPFIYFLFYILWFFTYWTYLKLTQNIKIKSKKKRVS
jgi:hypothetical protein